MTWGVLMMVMTEAQKYRNGYIFKIYMKRVVGHSSPKCLDLQFFFLRLRCLRSCLRAICASIAGRWTRAYIPRRF